MKQKNDYERSVDFLKERGYKFDEVKKEWVKANKFKRISISDKAIKESVSFPHLFNSLESER